MSAAAPFSLLTWNLWQYSVPWTYSPPRAVVADYPADAPRPGPGACWAIRRAGVLRALADLRPDLVLLQEAATDADAAPGAPNQAHQIEAAAGYQAVYARASRSSRRVAEHGQAVLYAPGWTVTGQTARALPHAGRAARDVPRLALAVDLLGPAAPLRVVNIHLSLDAEARARSVALLLDDPALAGDPAVPCVLAGDCNDLPDGATIGRLRAAGWVDAWAAAAPGDPGPTFPTPDPFLRLDYVFLSPGAGLRVVAATRVGLTPDAAGFYPSDHAGAVRHARAGVSAVHGKPEGMVRIQE